MSNIESSATFLCLYPEESGKKKDSKKRIYMEPNSFAESKRNNPEKNHQPVERDFRELCRKFNFTKEQEETAWNLWQRNFTAAEIIKHLLDK